LLKSAGFNLSFDAHKYRNRGWSVIPLNGSSVPDRAKLPALAKWETFQKRLPTDSELDVWFNQQAHQGIGIICGKISALGVLDLDDPTAAADFAAQYPHLTKTLTICSGQRRLPHYYFHVPADLAAKTQRAAGAEFRYEGCYVVAAPTSDGTNHWQITQDLEPKVLTAEELQQIIQFLTTRTKKQATKPLARKIKTHAQTNDLLKRYQQQAAAGRNNALFYTSIYARNCGWSQQAVENLLAVPFIQTNQRINSSPETERQRQHEAQRTIASAFKRPPQNTAQQANKPQQTGLPNNLREVMLQNGKHTTAAARLLDALYSEKTISPQTTITKPQIIRIAHKHHIGHRSITNAIQALYNEQRLFKTVTTSKDTQTNHRTKKCFFGNEPTRVKTSIGGRPPVYYLLPTPDELCKLFGVKAQYSDPLNSGDFASPKAYRQALYREFVRRRPGQYGREWLANRLGVSAKTCRRYDRALGVTAQPMYCGWTVSWANVRFLADNPELVPAHAFLETADGKRYPAQRQIACKLLKARHKVVCKYRRPNFYFFADSAIVPPPMVTWNEHLPTSNRPTPLPKVALPTGAPHSGAKLKAPPAPTTPHFVQPSLWTPHEMALNDAANDGLSLWLCADCLKTCTAKSCPDHCENCGAKALQHIPDTVWRVPEAHQHWWRKVWKQHQAKQKAALRH